MDKQTLQSFARRVDPWDKWRGQPGTVGQRHFAQLQPPAQDGHGVFASVGLLATRASSHSTDGSHHSGHQGNQQRFTFQTLPCGGSSPCGLWEKRGHLGSPSWSADSPQLGFVRYSWPWDIQRDTIEYKCITGKLGKPGNSGSMKQMSMTYWSSMTCPKQREFRQSTANSQSWSNMERCSQAWCIAARMHKK